MNKFKCKVVKKVTVFHNFIAWFACAFLKTEIFYCTLENLKKELGKKKRMIKNIKRLIKESSEEEIRIQFKKAFEEIDKWQEEVKVMEEELKRI